MSKEIYHVITANRLIEGNVVYLDENDCWSDHLANAATLSSEQQVQTKLIIAADYVARQVVLDPYAVEIDCNGPGELVPVRARERIRASGPSVSINAVRQSCMNLINPTYPQYSGVVDQCL